MADFDRNQWLRDRILRKPSGTTQEILDQWTKDKTIPRGTKALVNPDIHSARYTLRMKYGVEKIDELPRAKPNGDPDTEALLKLLLKKHENNLTEKQATNFMRQDGLNLTPEVFVRVLGEVTGKTPKPADNGGATAAASASKPAAPSSPPTGGTADEESPDANQTSGPRARHFGQPGRPPKDRQENDPVPAAPQPAPAVPSPAGEGTSRIPPHVVRDVPATNGPTGDAPLTALPPHEPTADATAATPTQPNLYVEMEEQIDGMMDKAKQAGDNPLVAQLRTLRRQVIRKQPENV